MVFFYLNLTAIRSKKLLYRNTFKPIFRTIQRDIPPLETIKILLFSVPSKNGIMKKNTPHRKLQQISSMTFLHTLKAKIHKVIPESPPRPNLRQAPNNETTINAIRG